MRNNIDISFSVSISISQPIFIDASISSKAMTALIESALKSTEKSLKSLEKSLNSTIFCRT